jgi:hypothetical protein
MPILTEDRPASLETPRERSFQSPSGRTPSAFAPKVREAGVRPARRRRGLLGLAVVTMAIVGTLLIAGFVTASLFKPFKTVTIDRTPPPVMVALKDLSTFKAAAGDYEVIIDTEKDVKYVPSWIAGERVVFIGVGSVDAVVDFRNLDSTSVTVSPDRLSATIILPPATLEPATIDFTKSRVSARKRGLLDRVSDLAGDDPTNDQPLYAAAAAKIDAAALAGDLQARAQANTTDMITRLLTAVGYTSVTVRFDGAPVSGPVSVTQVSASPSA